MPKANKACALIAHLLEEQLRTLPLSIAAVSGAFARRDFKDVTLRRKLSLVKTGSGGNIVAEEGVQSLPLPAREESECQRVLVANALLAVGAFMQSHGLLSMRTPEIQFLGHVMKGLLNANTFDIPAGYRPSACFDGLVICDAVHGRPVFTDSRSEGFMELGDGIALLQWLARYLSGETSYVSGGDAG